MPGLEHAHPPVVIATTRCPYCAEEIKRDALACGHCGRSLAHLRPPMPAHAVPVHAAPQRVRHPALAALLSLLIPGAGQMYKGQVIHGIGWLFGVLMGYVLFVFPGLILHILCSLDAARGAPRPAQRSAGGTAAAAPAKAPATRGAAYGCPACGRTVRRGDLTCASCGVELPQPA